MKKKFLVEYVNMVVENYTVEVMANDELEAQEFVEKDIDSDKLKAFSDLKDTYVDSSEITDVKEVV